MADDFADRLATANRVSIRAVLALQGQDVQQALLESGILDPVTIPYALDDGTPESAAALGNGMTPNLQATLDLGEEEPPTSGGSTQKAPAQPREPVSSATVTAQRAFGQRSLAPIRQR